MAAAVLSTATRAAASSSLRSLTSSSSSAFSFSCSSAASTSSRRSWISPGFGSRNFSVGALRSEKHYTKAHEWIELSTDGKIGTIGVSEYAAKSLGDVVYVELPAKDLEVAAGDAIGAVESVKSASDIYSPLGGKVVDANEALESKPGTLNSSPEGEGWIARIEVAAGDAAGLSKLMDKNAYVKFTEEEEE